jgi:hypothetical protein
MTFGAADALDLLDWKRQVFALYGRIRGGSDPRLAWELWRETRDRLYREHPQSPVPAEQRAGRPCAAPRRFRERLRTHATAEPRAPTSGSRDRYRKRRDELLEKRTR